LRCFRTPLHFLVRVAPSGVGKTKGRAGRYFDTSEAKRVMWWTRCPEWPGQALQIIARYRLTLSRPVDPHWERVVNPRLETANNPTGSVN
jgi:hypothetical protein